MTEPERMLRAAFEAAAARVDVAPDALPAIRARVGVRARRRRMLTVSLAAAATVAVVAGGVAYALGRPGPAIQPGPSGGPTITQPSTPDTSPAPGIGVRVPVYFLGDEGNLFREYHFLTVLNDTLADRIQVAASRSVGGDAYDPDYDTAWPPEFPDVLDWQWQERAIPYWTEATAFAANHGVKGAEADQLENG